jgi:hypothetical protein
MITEVRDAYQRLLGTIKELPNGDKEVRGPTQQRLGSYSAGSDMTSDRNFKPVYRGDQTAALLREG